MATSPAFTPVRATEIHDSAHAAGSAAVSLHQVSWGAILAGAVAALVAQMILNMVGLGIGLAVLNPAGSDNPAAGSLSLGAGLW